MLHKILKGSAPILLALCVVVVSQSAVFAQSPSIDFRTDRNYVFENTVNGLLPFAVVISNPTAAPLSNVQLVITMPAGINLGNVDSECTQAVDTGSRTLDCTVPSVAAFSSKVLDFFVDGPNSTAVGASFTLAITSSSVPVSEPDAFEASLADGNTLIRGAILNIHLVRDINLDIDQNGVPDLDEAIMKMPTGTSVEQLLARKAVIDVLFLYSPAAEQYLDGKLQSRIAQYLTATNQIFRENEIGIELNGVGLASVPYAVTDSTLTTILDTMQAGTDVAFNALNQHVTSSGGDLIVFLHALSPGTDTYCGFSALNGVGRQGDFRSEYHQGAMISVVNVGPDCLDLKNLAPLFAGNMGIVSTRQEAPDGGTFSYAAGYGITDVFATLTARLGALPFGQAQLLDQFSNPASLCNSFPCGIDRNDIAQGADAVFSLNKTRHLVSGITPSVFPIDPDSLPEKVTVSPSLNYDLEITQTPVDAGALYNEFTEIQVDITNVSGETLRDLDVSFAHLNGGLLSNEVQTYENSQDNCGILGPDLATTGIFLGLAQQKAGRLSCFIDALEPAANFNFSYRIQIDNSPPLLNNEGYYHELVTVNGIAQLESEMCLPVFANFILANLGSTVCDNVAILIPGLAPDLPLDLNALPSVTGSMLSLPFLRLWDGSLVSVEIRITLTGPVALEIVSYADLDPLLIPAYEASYDDLGVLHIDNLQVDTAFYDVQATYVQDSIPIRFDGITAILVVPGP